MRTRILLLIAFFQMATLAFGQQLNFYGTTSEGGEYNLGTIFKTDTNGGNLTTLYSARDKDGKQPLNSKLCLASNGKYYGLTSDGGIYSSGIIYEYNFQNNKYKILYHFQVGQNGSTPNGSLIQASNGKLYGLTVGNGLYGDGTIFEFDIPTNVLTIKVSFTYTNGSKPLGTLLEASNGKLYGLTSEGGVYNKGVLFEYDIITDTYLQKINFDGLNGDGVIGSLIEATNGKLYGVSKDGGALTLGNLFEYTIATNTLVTKIDFLGFSNGSRPYESPIQAANGKLYGFTSLGGANNQGVLYEYDIATNILTKKVEFSSAITGSSPRGSLLETSNGNLYGTTYEGGASNNGVLFKYNYSTNTYSKKLEFNGQQIGSSPLGTLVRNGINSIIGTTSMGGETSNGVLFEYNISIDSLKKVLDFGAKDKIKNPRGKLTYADNGKLYGVSFNGGLNSGGALFEFDPKNLSVTIKHEVIPGLTSVFVPVGDLINTNDGYLYGLSHGGSATNLPVIFRYDYILDTIIDVHTFPSVGGLYTYRKYSLFHHSNGKLYGIGVRSSPTSSTLFEYDIKTNTYVELYNFQSIRKSLFLKEGPGGEIYGASKQEFQFPQKGYLFKFDLTTSSFTTIHTFNGLDGGNPSGELVLAGNGKFYGVTTYGGINDYGVLYEYNPNNNLYTKKLDFDSINGAKPEDGLLELNHGKLFGTTMWGGTNNLGTIYEYDYVSNTIRVAHNFDSISKGSHPMGRLVKAKDCGITRVFNTVNQCKSYTSPSGKYIWTNSGVYSDTLFNNGCDSILSINLTVVKINNTVAAFGPTTLAANNFNATYQWLDCNNNYAIIPNEIGQLFTATAIGNYAVELTANGCVDTSACYPITVVGISDNQLSNNLAVFPNPTNSNVTLSLGGAYGAFTTQVFNVHGMLINESAHQSANQVEVELGDSEGIYFIHLITKSGEKVVRKVVKN